MVTIGNTEENYYSELLQKSQPHCFILYSDITPELRLKLLHIVPQHTRVYTIGNEIFRMLLPTYLIYTA